MRKKPVFKLNGRKKVIQDNNNKHEQPAKKPDLKNLGSSSAGDLDIMDKKMLQVLQDDFPIVAQPWLEISHRLGISEKEVIWRLKRLMEVGAVLKIGPIFDSAKIGYNVATLVAMRVPKDRVNQVASKINQFSNISHNYERENEYNIWFTLSAKDDKELNKVLSEIKQKTGVGEQDILDLPTIRRFKINVHFQLA
jgi:DNA-binding Lrp family transcriptional regulator